MKITLLTTLPSLIENERLKEEAKKLSHQLDIVSLKDLKFSIKDNQLHLPGLTDIKTDVLILRGVFNSLKIISTVTKHLREKGTKVFDNSFLDHQYSIDKITDLVKLSLENIPTPQTHYSRDYSDYHQFAKQSGFPLIIKSTRMGKGASVFKIDNQTQLDTFIDDIQEQGKSAKSYLLQEYIPYIDDLRILVIGNNTFTMKRIPAPGEFRANFSLGGSVELFDLQPKDKELSIKALKAVDMSIGGVDVLISKNQERYILEVNHTAGFVGMEKATGKNIAKIWLQHAIKTAK